jgi:hypothetical protein
LADNLPDQLHAFGAFIEQNDVVFNAAGPGRLYSGPGMNKIISQNEGVVLIVKNP